jgi:hypothetical protein
MAINLKSTRGAASDGVKVLVYGGPGSGKTTLIGTLPEPIIISAEAGLLSLADLDIPYIEVTDMASLKEAYSFVTSEEAIAFKSVAVDSISEIAEVVLSYEKKNNKDPRMAYGEMQTQMVDLIRAFRDISGKNVYMSAKQEKLQDETGRILYGPGAPGKQLGPALPYYFDEVLALRVEKDEEGKPQRALMCDSDGLWSAKDRSGKLSPWETADLSYIINKIAGNTK